MTPVSVLAAEDTPSLCCHGDSYQCNEGEETQVHLAPKFTCLELHQAIVLVLPGDGVPSRAVSF